MASMLKMLEEDPPPQTEFLSKPVRLENPQEALAQHSEWVHETIMHWILDGGREW